MAAYTSDIIVGNSESAILWPRRLTDELDLDAEACALKRGALLEISFRNLSTIWINLESR